MIVSIPKGIPTGQRSLWNPGETTLLNAFSNMTIQIFIANKSNSFQNRIDAIYKEEYGLKTNVSLPTPVKTVTQVCSH